MKLWIAIVVLSNLKDFVGAFETVEQAKEGIIEWGEICNIAIVQYVEFHNGTLHIGETSIRPFVTDIDCKVIIFEYELGTVSI